MAWQASEAAAAAADGRQPVRAAAHQTQVCTPAGAAAAKNSSPRHPLTAIRLHERRALLGRLRAGRRGGLRRWAGSCGGGGGVLGGALGRCCSAPSTIGSMPLPNKVLQRAPVGGQPASHVAWSRIAQAARSSSGIGCCKGAQPLQEAGASHPQSHVEHCTVSSCAVILCSEVHQQMDGMCQFKVSSPGRDLDLPHAAAAGWRRLAARPHELGSAPCCAQYCILLAKPAGSLDLLSRLQRAQ